MIKSLFLAFVLFTCNAFGNFDYQISNTNFTLSQGSVFPNEESDYLYNYNRLRLRGDITDGNFFLTFIGDGVNYLGHDYVNSRSFDYIKEQKSDTPFKTTSSFNDYYEGSFYSKLYRFYGGYEDNDRRIVLGLQNITMGVGRIWTPSNLFNPRNIYALEPDETYGVAALSYTHHLTTTSDITLVLSQKADHTYKYAARYKAFLDISDVAINLISSDATKMAAYEIEANLADTGIEVRSEGAYIRHTLKTALNDEEEQEFFQGILGADYGFENGVNVIGEVLYSSKSFEYEEILLNYDSQIMPNLVNSKFYTAISVAYSFNLFLDASVVYIESFNDANSRFITPTLTYTLNDYNTFTLGAMLENGPKESEFGMFSDTYYFRYALSF
jgi:hypothetical protein